MIKSIVISFCVLSFQNQWIHLKCKWGDTEGVRHSDDVLSADYASRAHLLATASFDGELLVWSTETQRLVTRLRRRQEPKMCANPLC